MKILFFGHSDSDGSQLADASNAFPWLLQRMLKDAAGVDAEITHRLLYAGPTAAAFVERQVAQLQPDVVVLATTTHNVVVRLVSSNVRARFGDRPARLAERAERWAARESHRPGTRGRGMLTLRQSARRVLGTRPTMTPADMVASYENCFSVLARVENLHTIVGGGIGYIGELRRLNPGIDQAQASLQKQFRELAEAHRFDWLSHEAVLGGPGAKDQYYFPDGMHTDERSHRLFAEALLPLVLARR